jgi:hypothetical protein
MIEKVHILVISQADRGGVFQPVAAGVDAETAGRAYQEWQKSELCDRALWQWDVRPKSGWVWMRVL